MVNVNAFSRMCVWISRIGCCRGFGVQSPWAYSFVRYVINEHFPYYQCKSLKERYTDLTKIERKLAEFYMRLANFVQPSKVFAVHHCSRRVNDCMEAYFHAGCKKCKYIVYDRNEGFQPPSERDSTPVIVYINASFISAEYINNMINELHDGDFIVIEGLKTSAGASLAWNLLKEQLKGVLMFDMYYCGVIFRDSNRYMQHYRINF